MYFVNFMLQLEDSHMKRSGIKPLKETHLGVAKALCDP